MKCEEILPGQEKMVGTSTRSDFKNRLTILKIGIAPARASYQF